MDDTEIKELLRQNIKLTQENNELLLKIRRVQRWSQVSKIFYWLIIVGIAFGAFYFIQPYFDGFLNIYSGGVSNFDMMKGLSENLGNGIKP